jgi:hypothetical protein
MSGQEARTDGYADAVLHMIKDAITRDIRMAQEHAVSILQYTAAGCDRFIEGLG